MELDHQTLIKYDDARQQMNMLPTTIVNNTIQLHHHALCYTPNTQRLALRQLAKH
jgi:hypothetical protein